jgi:hypothetical protein
VSKRSTEIGGVTGITSKSLTEADGKFDRTRAQADKGAGSVIGPYGAPNAVLRAGKPSVVNGAGPSPGGPVRQPGKKR